MRRKSHNQIKRAQADGDRLAAKTTRTPLTPCLGRCGTLTVGGRLCRSCHASRKAAATQPARDTHAGDRDGGAA